ncbi:N-acetylglucosamine/diacetylchitobiose ABC transporter substrate-binding protein [Catellatospora tritici]|uniref:N-acetylglucosamine/diacetylchitobiose ABC transporter substrate-binding protein n=1 Tax=Catellatospora tritici TaxID=2851566 RepID=UPI001C2DB519|nr:N-acetylglucosamine/diacetylchitobiose ABC transporter substrate-binding protein [Catellatospora tritici]MBV1849934.1 N-acetylglucosamine/diacetylchitobiose ABC transporter substrate-binding protein [Catellatospora tritici]
MTVTPDSPSELNRRTVLRRAAAAGLLATPAAGILAACASTDNGGDTGDKGATSESNPFGVDGTKPVEAVVFDGGFGQDYAKYYAASYEKKYSGSKVGIVWSKEIQTDLQPRFAGNNPPDVINNSSPKTLGIDVLVANSQVEDLTQLFDAGSVDDPKVKVKETLLAGVIDEGLYNDKPYTLNAAFTVYGFFHDATLFAAKGWTVPKTWEEFLTLAENAKKEGIAAFTHQGKYPWYMNNVIIDWVWKVGGKSAVVAIDNLDANAWKAPAVVTVIDKIKEMLDKGYVQPGAAGLDHTTTQQAVIDGKALFIPCGTWLEGEMAKTLKPDTKLEVTAQWSLTASDASPYGTIRAAAGEGWIVPSGGKNKQGGLEFLRLMLSKDNARKFAELTKSLPVVKGAAEGLTGSSQFTSANKALAEAGTNIVSTKFGGWYPDLYKAFEGAISNLMAGKGGSAEFTDAMQKAADKIAADPNVKKQKRTN